MDPRLEIDYGELPQPSRLTTLIARAQSAPHNWFGRKLAKFCRSRVLSGLDQPLDVEVEGIRMRVLLKDNNSERRYVFMPWLFDAEERELIAERLPPEGVFVDIGANVGIYSLWAARHLGAAGTLVAFEPNPPAYKRLSFNLRANQELAAGDWPTVHCLQKGVSEREGEFSLYLDPTNLGGSSLVMQADKGTQTKVLCVPLKEELERLSINTVHALKIDIEGAEDIALIPFFETAPDHLFPKLIVMERTHQDTQSDLDECLKSKGYKILNLTRMNAVYSLDKI